MKTQKRNRSIVTGKGDAGMTRLSSGAEVSKDDPWIEACGCIDELLSILGVACVATQQKLVLNAVKQIQKKLFVVGAILGGGGESSSGAVHVEERDIEELSRKCSVLEGRMALPEGFVVPGGSLGSAHLDQARTVARRCERRIVAVLRGGADKNEYLLPWMNRLSDYLWLLARFEETKKRGLQKSYSLNLRK